MTFVCRHLQMRERQQRLLHGLVCHMSKYMSYTVEYLCNEAPSWSLEKKNSLYYCCWFRGKQSSFGLAAPHFVDILRLSHLNSTIFLRPKHSVCSIGSWIASKFKIINQKMVLLSVIRQSAAKRIPLIKFRRQREEEATLSRSGSLSSGDLKGKSSSPAAVCVPWTQKCNQMRSYESCPLFWHFMTRSCFSAQAISFPTIEDWQLPNRYRRKPLDAAEIEYINRGGPA